MKANRKQRAGGHDSKVAREEVRVCETAQDRVVSWEAKGSKHKEKEMEQGRNGIGMEGQEVGLPREFPRGAELEESWASKKDHLPYRAKCETRWILFISLFLKRSHLIFRLIHL